MSFVILCFSLTHTYKYYVCMERFFWIHYQRFHHLHTFCDEDFFFIFFVLYLFLLFKIKWKIKHEKNFFYARIIFKRRENSSHLETVLFLCRLFNPFSFKHTCMQTKIYIWIMIYWRHHILDSLKKGKKIEWMKSSSDKGISLQYFN